MLKRKRHSSAHSTLILKNARHCPLLSEQESEESDSSLEKVGGELSEDEQEVKPVIQTR